MNIQKSQVSRDSSGAPRESQNRSVLRAMWIKIERSRAVRFSFTSFWVLAILLSFQNCAPGFETMGLSSLDSNELMSSMNGKTLYSGICAQCHGPIESSSKMFKPADKIKEALTRVPQMAAYKDLTDMQINAIADVLNPRPPSDPMVNPYMCEPGADPAPAHLRRLTRREYINTVLDLFTGQITAGDLQTQFNYIDEEALDTRPILNLFDSMNPTPMTLKLITGYNGVAAKAADLITASVTKMNAVAGNTCVTQSSVTDACLNTFLTSFGLKVYRRPLTTQEKTEYITLYRTGTSTADSMARVLEAMLQAPQFLYLIEDNGTPVAGRQDLLQLSPYEIASRLSYMILGSMPDSELFNAAASGSLSTLANIQTQVDRLFALPRAKEQVRTFYSQWLRLEKIPVITVTPEFAAGIDPNAFRSEARQEVIDFMDHMIWTQKANLQAVLTSDLTFVKGPNLAKIYGVTASNTAQKINDANRKGLLTKPGMLAMSSIGTPDPIKRGVRARLHLLCDHLGDPENNVNLGAERVDPLSSIREQTAARTSPEACMRCHASINPLGFSFGHYDGFGRFITQETVSSNGQARTHTIDARVLPAIAFPNEPQIDGAVELQERMANNNKVSACMAKQWLQYNVGRPKDLSGGDDCALSSMYDSLTRSGGSMLDMFKTLSGAESFRRKKLSSN